MTLRRAHRSVQGSIMGVRMLMDIVD